MKITTTGVLLRKALRTPAAMITRKMDRRPLVPPSLPKARAGPSMASVANSPWPTMSRAMTVASAGSEKPLSRIAGVSATPSGSV